MLALENYGKLPLQFEKNQGQVHSDVKFLARGRGYNLFLTASEIVLVLYKSPNNQPLKSNEELKVEDIIEKQPENEQIITKVVKIKITEANTEPIIEGMEELPGKVNYFKGNDPSKWQTNISTYSKVKFKDIYPGIDMIYYGNENRLEYDFIIAPGVDPNAISLDFEGMEQLELNEKGDLIVKISDDEEVCLQKPFIYQKDDDNKEEVSGEYILKNNKICFNLEKYDTTKPLIIDPQLDYSTYLGGSLQDYGNGIAVDSDGNAYVTGETRSIDFPTQNPLQSFVGPSDAFVTKLNANGSAMIYSTYLGGDQEDAGNGIAVDSSGNAYITGYTGPDAFAGNNLSGNNFPTTEDAVQRDYGGKGDAFVTKLNAYGSAMIYSTFLGGNEKDAGKGIAVDSSGNAYITGYTESFEGYPIHKGFPTENPIQSYYAGNRDAFVTKLNADGSGLIYSTYLGGNQEDVGNGIEVDSCGNAYITGSTRSEYFPTKNPIQPDYGGGFRDAFVTKLNANGSRMIYSTYLGGESDDVGNGIAVDSDGNAYITGYTFSRYFPTLNPLQCYGGGFRDAFVTKLNTNGSEMIYSTYLGGSWRDEGNGIAVDSCGNAYITGSTGWYTSIENNFPTKNPIQLYRGSYDAFIAKISLYADLSIAKAHSPDSVIAGNMLTYTMTITNNGPDTATDVALTDNLPGSLNFISAISSQGICNKDGGVVTANLNSLDIGDTATVTLVSMTTGVGTIPNTAIVTCNEGDTKTVTEDTEVLPYINLFITKSASPYPVIVGNQLTYTITITNNGPDTANDVTLIDNLPESTEFVSAISSEGTWDEESGVVTANLGSLNSGYVATVTIVVKPTQDETITNTAIVTCNEGETKTITVNTEVLPYADLYITKSDSPDPVIVGNQLTYTITITNNGPDTANDVTLVDNLPESVDFVSAISSHGSCNENDGVVTANLGSLNKVDTAAVTIVVIPTQDKTITNTATVSCNEGETKTVTEDTEVLPYADLFITKSDSPDLVINGNELTYTISITNNGPDTATDVTVTDTLPISVDFVSAISSQGICYENNGVVIANLDLLNQGEVAYVTIVVIPTQAKTILNTATVTSNEGETKTVTEYTDVLPYADLYITKSDSPDPVIVGNQLTYTITITNNGPDTANDVTLVDNLPESVYFVSAISSQGSCNENDGVVTANLGSLNKVDTAAVTIVVKPTQDETITNTAIVTCNEGETKTVTENTEVLPYADLYITKSDSPDPVIVGNELTYTITITNNGPDTATDVTLTDTLPISVDFVSAISSQGTCNENDGVVTANLGLLNKGDTATVTIVVIPTLVESILNTATVTSNESEPKTVIEGTRVFPIKFIGKVPVVKKIFSVNINVKAIVKLQKFASDIKDIHKKVCITQYTLCPICLPYKDNKWTKYQLFITGYVKKNIRYCNENCNANGDNGCISGKVIYTTCEIPFKYLTTIDLPNNSWKRHVPSFQDKFEILNKSGLCKNPYEEHLVDFENFNEHPYCELVNSVISEYDFVQNLIENRDFKELEEKMVVTVTLRILQNEERCIQSILI